MIDMKIVVLFKPSMQPENKLGTLSLAGFPVVVLIISTELFCCYWLDICHSIIRFPTRFSPPLLEGWNPANPNITWCINLGILHRLWSLDYISIIALFYHLRASFPLTICWFKTMSFKWSSYHRGVRGNDLACLKWYVGI